MDPFYPVVTSLQKPLSVFQKAFLQRLSIHDKLLSHLLKGGPSFGTAQKSLLTIFSRVGNQKRAVKMWASQKTCQKPHCWLSSMRLTILSCTSSSQNINFQRCSIYVEQNSVLCPTGQPLDLYSTGWTWADTEICNTPNCVCLSFVTAIIAHPNARTHHDFVIGVVSTVNKCPLSCAMDSSENPLTALIFWKVYLSGWRAIDCCRLI